MRHKRTRIKREHYMANQMLETLKAIRLSRHEQPVGAWWGAIDNIIRVIEQSGVHPDNRLAYDAADVIEELVEALKPFAAFWTHYQEECDHARAVLTRMGVKL